VVHATQEEEEEDINTYYKLSSRRRWKQNLEITQKQSLHDATTGYMFMLISH